MPLGLEKLSLKVKSDNEVPSTPTSYARAHIEALISSSALTKLQVYPSEKQGHVLPPEGPPPSSEAPPTYAVNPPATTNEEILGMSAFCFRRS